MKRSKHGERERERESSRNGKNKRRRKRRRRKRVREGKKKGALFPHCRFYVFKILKMSTPAALSRSFWASSPLPVPCETAIYKGEQSISFLLRNKSSKPPAGNPLSISYVWLRTSSSTAGKMCRRGCPSVRHVSFFVPVGFPLARERRINRALIPMKIDCFRLWHNFKCCGTRRENHNGHTHPGRLRSTRDYLQHLPCKRCPLPRAIFLTGREPNF